MNNLKSRFARMGILIPEVLLPNNKEMEKWAVVACDQYSSEKEYWETTKSIVGDSPSTLNLILPECYLEDSDKPQRVENINSTMNEYISKDIFKKLKPGFIIVDRSTLHVPSRKGMMIAIDLDQYSFAADTRSLIRPTEGTVIDRLPPRIEIRKNAPLDLPHILLLINDEDNSIIEEAFHHTELFETVYDFELMQNGGKIKGQLISDEVYLNKICTAFEKLAEKNDMLFAVGDGNHSLATAKEIWKKLKSEGVSEDHPARYALVEVENIFNEGIVFEPIHRVLFNVESTSFFSELKKASKSEFVILESESAMKQAIQSDSKDHRIGFIDDGKWGYISIDDPQTKLTSEVLQKFLDAYLRENSTVSLDYIHGDKPVYDLGGKKGNLGLYLTAIKKSEFFDMIVDGGALPRKTFSIGEAEEKRYYIESRKITL